TQALVDQPPGDPTIAARLLASLGTVHANFGRMEPASALFERSYDANPDLEILVRWANAMLELGDNDGAADLFEQAHARRATMSPEMQAFHGASYAQLEVLRGQLDTARRLAEEAARVAPAGSVDEVYAVDTLAQVLFHSGDIEAAARVGQQALNVAIDYYGDPHLQVSTSRNNLALFLGRLGQDEQALALLEQAVEDVTELLGPDDPRLTVGLSNLANRRSDQGQLSAAIEAHDQALRLTRQHYGESHPSVGLIQGNRALTLMRQGALLEAEAEFRAALALLDETPLYRVRVGLAATGNHVLLGQLEQAEALLDVVSDDVDQLYPTDHARHGSVLEMRALIALESNDTEEANRLLALLDRFDAADTARLRLLQVQAAAQAGDCDSALSAWAAVDPAAEFKKAALYRAASSVLSSGCD
ncbi:MAG: tetratricopeptide repeat protein, partial [Pseudomonadota bacterium]